MFNGGFQTKASMATKAWVLAQIAANDLVDAVRSITANVIGNLTGNVTGNVVGNLTGNASGTAASITGSLTGDVTSTAMATTVATVGDATAAEVALQCDVSAQTETIIAGAISVVKRITKLDTTAGAELFTLAAPDATMLGQVKIINFVTDNGDATLTLTNVQGGSAATTVTWANVGEELVLVGGTTKWNVIGEGGVVLS